MTKELSQVWAAEAVRRLTQELDLKPKRLLRMRWVLTWKYTEGGDRKDKARYKLRVRFGDVSSAFLQTSASEEHQELTIKAPPEVGSLFSDSEGKHARYVRLLKSVYGLTSAPRAWLVGHHTETFSAWMETHVDWSVPVVSML